MKSKFKKWLKAAGIRALRTAAQGALAVMGTNVFFLGDVNWAAVASGAAMAAVMSIIMAIAGLPEVDTDKNSKEE